MDRIKQLTGASSERIHYIDIMRGILILLVVLGHNIYTTEYSTSEHVTDSISTSIGYLHGRFIAPFFMAAFFMITGYVANFSKSLTEQVKRDFRTLILPAILLPLLMTIFEINFPSSLIKRLTKILTLDIPWFLTAMFWAKLLFKIVNDKLRTDAIKLVIFSFISLIGCLILYYFNSPNVLGIFHGMAFVIFIAISNYLIKRRLRANIFMILCSLVFYILCVIYIHPTAICITINFHPIFWPVYILIACCGSYLLYCVSYYISKSNLLEFLGRNSLIIYLTHYYGMFIFAYLFMNNLSISGNYIMIIYHILLFVLGVLWGVVWSKLFSLKYLRVIIGMN